MPYGHNAEQWQTRLSVQHLFALQVIIKVTDSCLCAITSTDAEGKVTVTGVNQPCCTNVPHFNIDYHAFEALAHPDYGYMNMRFRWASPPVMIMIN